MSPRRPRLYADRGCPFAHRVLALLEHLNCEHVLIEAPVGDKPKGLAQHSPSERIPFLVHGDIAISESRVMLEYLAEHHDFRGAFPADLETRTLHRHAMALVDDFLAPLLFRAYTAADALRLTDTLDAIEDATGTVAPGPCLLAFHIAPIWLRFQWWHPEGPVTRAMAARTDLARWLDAANHLDSLSRTAPDRATHLADIERARRAGLIPASLTPARASNI